MALDGSLRPPFSPVQPGAYSVVDASALQAIGLPGLPIPVVIGACLGGPPNQLLLFRDAQALKNRVRSGAAFDVARFVLGTNAQLVGVVRAGSGILRATKSLAGATGTPVVLTALDYGSWTNNIKVTVATNNTVTISYKDSNGITYNEVFPVGSGATAQNVVDAINGKRAGFPNPSQYVSAAVGSGTMPLSSAAQANMTGGNDGSALGGGDWTNALVAIEAEDVDIIIPATGDATVHAQVQTHCDSMSVAAARRERTCVVGGVLGESVAVTVARMANFDDARLQLVYPGTVDFDANGVLKTWDPFYMAGKIAGMHCAQPDAATALTHEIVPTVDLEQQGGNYLSTNLNSDIDTLLRAGVTPIAPAGQAPGKFWVVDSLSSYTDDDSFRDFHKIRTADVVSVRLRTGLEAQFVGKKALEGIDGDIGVFAGTILQELKDEGLLRAFLDAVVTAGVDSRSWNVTAPVLLPEATKFIYITVALQPSSAVNNASLPSDDALL